MDIRRALSTIVHERLKTKSELDAIRFVNEAKGGRYDSLINILLDKLNNLNKLENELNKQLKNRRNKP